MGWEAERPAIAFGSMSANALCDMPKYVSSEKFPPLQQDPVYPLHSEDFICTYNLGVDICATSSAMKVFHTCKPSLLHERRLSLDISIIELRANLKPITR